MSRRARVSAARHGGGIGIPAIDAHPAPAVRSARLDRKIRRCQRGPRADPLRRRIDPGATRRGDCGAGLPQTRRTGPRPRGPVASVEARAPGRPIFPRTITTGHMPVDAACTRCAPLSAVTHSHAEECSTDSNTLPRTTRPAGAAVQPRLRHQDGETLQEIGRHHPLRKFGGDVLDGRPRSGPDIAARHCADLAPGARGYFIDSVCSAPPRRITRASVPAVIATSIEA